MRVMDGWMAMRVVQDSYDKQTFNGQSTDCLLFTGNQIMLWGSLPNSKEDNEMSSLQPAGEQRNHYVYNS